MSKFGAGSGRLGSKSAAAEGKSDDGRREEHISVKDNRRIDPKTGQVRSSAGEAPAGGGAAARLGSIAEGAGDVIPEKAGMTAGASSGDANSAELVAAQAELAERTGDLQRITAEYANYRKRADRDKQAAAVAGKASVVAELLAVLDDLDRADEHGDLTGGFKTVADKLTDTLARIGLSHYGQEGDEFDPNIHEAVQFTTAADVDHPTVTMVLRRGYLFEERVLRPAVVVVTGPEHEPDAVGAAESDGASSNGGESSDDAASDGAASDAVASGDGISGGSADTDGDVDGSGSAA